MNAAPPIAATRQRRPQLQIQIVETREEVEDDKAPPNVGPHKEQGGRPKLAHGSKPTSGKAGKKGAKHQEARKEDASQRPRVQGDKCASEGRSEAAKSKTFGNVASSQPQVLPPPAPAPPLLLPAAAATAPPTAAAAGAASKARAPPRRTKSYISDDLTLLRRFVPDLLITYLEDHGTPTNPQAGGKSGASGGSASGSGGGGSAVSDFCQAACVCLDISGFSALSERLCQRGEDGLDNLVGVINSCMGTLMNLVYFLRGDVIKVAGDALYCVFPEQPTDHTVPSTSSRNGSVTDAGSRQAALLAVACALAVRDRRHRRLPVHAGVGIGEMCFAVLGVGEGARWECLVSGPPIIQVAEALEQAASQQVVLHRVCHALVADAVLGKVLPGGNFLAEAILPAAAIGQLLPAPPLRRSATSRGNISRHDCKNPRCSGCEACHALRDSRRSLDDAAAPCGMETCGDSEQIAGNASNAGADGRFAGNFGAGGLSADDGCANEVNHRARGGAFGSSGSGSSVRGLLGSKLGGSHHRGGHRRSSGSLGVASARASIDTRLINTLKRFVPTPVLDNVTAGSLDCMAELREVTTMFMRWDGYSAEANRDLRSLGPYFDVVSRALAHREGFLRQFLIDDKGCVLIACWGVPSATHPDNPDRAVEAATAAWSKLGHMGMAASVGITTGRALCGNVGSKLRCEYAMVGDVINLAARLMGAAGGSIMCDEATRRAVKTGRRVTRVATFTPLPPIQVKGKQTTINPFLVVPTNGAHAAAAARLAAAAPVAAAAVATEAPKIATASSAGALSAVTGTRSAGSSAAVNESASGAASGGAAEELAASAEEAAAVAAAAVVHLQALPPPLTLPSHSDDWQRSPQPQSRQQHQLQQLQLQHLSLQRRDSEPSPSSPHTALMFSPNVASAVSPATVTSVTDGGFSAVSGDRSGATSMNNGHSAALGPAGLFGREEVRHGILEALARLAGRVTPSFIVAEGAASMGKTTILRFARDAGQGFGYRVVSGDMERASRRYVPYSCLSSVFRHISGLARGGRDVAKLRRVVAALLRRAYGDDTDAVRLRAIPALRALLGLDRIGGGASTRGAWQHNCHTPDGALSYVLLRAARDHAAAISRSGSAVDPLAPTNGPAEREDVLFGTVHSRASSAGLSAGGGAGPAAAAAAANNSLNSSLCGRESASSYPLNDSFSMRQQRRRSGGVSGADVLATDAGGSGAAAGNLGSEQNRGSENFPTRSLSPPPSVTPSLTPPPLFSPPRSGSYNSNTSNGFSSNMGSFNAQRSGDLLAAAGGATPRSPVLYSYSGSDSGLLKEPKLGSAELQAALVKLFCAAMDGLPLVVLLDNVHLMDAYSWSLLLELACAGGGGGGGGGGVVGDAETAGVVSCCCLFVLALQPMDERRWSFAQASPYMMQDKPVRRKSRYYFRLLHSSSCQRFELLSFTREEVARALSTLRSSQRVESGLDSTSGQSEESEQDGGGGDRPFEEVVDRVLELSGGNPYWAAEIVALVREVSVRQFMEDFKAESRKAANTARPSISRAASTQRLCDMPGFAYPASETLAAVAAAAAGPTAGGLVTASGAAEMASSSSSGIVTVRNGDGNGSSSNPPVGASSYNYQKIIVHRLERRSVKEQAVARHASVLGLVCPLRVLEAVLPLRLRAVAKEALEGLVSARFIELVDEESEADVANAGSDRRNGNLHSPLSSGLALGRLHSSPPPQLQQQRQRQQQRADGAAAGESGGVSYRFVNLTVQQAVYLLTPLSDRRRIHAAVARFYEQEIGRQGYVGSGSYATAARHYLLAEADDTKVVEMATKAAAQALVRGDHAEMLGWIGTAMSHATAAPEVFEIFTVVSAAQQHLEMESRRNLHRGSSDNHHWNSSSGGGGGDAPLWLPHGRAAGNTPTPTPPTTSSSSRKALQPAPSKHEADAAFLGIPAAWGMVNRRASAPEACSPPPHLSLVPSHSVGSNLSLQSPSPAVSAVSASGSARTGRRKALAAAPAPGPSAAERLEQELTDIGRKLARMNAEAHKARVAAHELAAGGGPPLITSHPSQSSLSTAANGPDFDDSDAPTTWTAFTVLEQLHGSAAARIREAEGGGATSANAPAGAIAAAAAAGDGGGRAGGRQHRRRRRRPRSLTPPQMIRRCRRSEERARSLSPGRETPLNGSSANPAGVGQKDATASSASPSPPPPPPSARASALLAAAANALETSALAAAHKDREAHSGAKHGPFHNNKPYQALSTKVRDYKERASRRNNANAAAAAAAAAGGLSSGGTASGTAFKHGGKRPGLGRSPPHNAEHSSGGGGSHENSSSSSRRGGFLSLPTTPANWFAGLGSTRSGVPETICSSGAMSASELSAASSPQNAAGGSASSAAVAAAAEAVAEATVAAAAASVGEKRRNRFFSLTPRHLTLPSFALPFSGSSSVGVTPRASPRSVFLPKGTNPTRGGGGNGSGGAATSKSAAGGAAPATARGRDVSRPKANVHGPVSAPAGRFQRSVVFFPSSSPSLSPPPREDPEIGSGAAAAVLPGSERPLGPNYAAVDGGGRRCAFVPELNQLSGFDANEAAAFANCSRRSVGATGGAGAEREPLWSVVVDATIVDDGGVAHSTGKIGSAIAQRSPAGANNAIAIASGSSSAAYKGTTPPRPPKERAWLRSALRKSSSTGHFFDPSSYNSNSNSSNSVSHLNAVSFSAASTPRALNTLSTSSAAPTPAAASSAALLPDPQGLRGRRRPQQQQRHMPGRSASPTTTKGRRGRLRSPEQRAASLSPRSSSLRRGNGGRRKRLQARRALSRMLRAPFRHSNNSQPNSSSSNANDDINSGLRTTLCGSRRGHRSASASAVASEDEEEDCGELVYHQELCGGEMEEQIAAAAVAADAVAAANVVGSLGAHFRAPEASPSPRKRGCHTIRETSDHADANTPKAAGVPAAAASGGRSRTWRWGYGSRGGSNGGGNASGDDHVSGGGGGGGGSGSAADKSSSGSWRRRDESEDARLSLSSRSTGAPTPSHALQTPLGTPTGSASGGGGGAKANAKAATPGSAAGKGPSKAFFPSASSSTDDIPGLSRQRQGSGSGGGAERAAASAAAAEHCAVASYTAAAAGDLLPPPPPPPHAILRRKRSLSLSATGSGQLTAVLNAAQACAAFSSLDATVDLDGGGGAAEQQQRHRNGSAAQSDRRGVLWGSKDNGGSLRGAVNASSAGGLHADGASASLPDFRRSRGGGNSLRALAAAVDATFEDSLADERDFLFLRERREREFSSNGSASSDILAYAGDLTPMDSKAGGSGSMPWVW